MTDVVDSAWPAVELDPVRRLKVIASAARRPAVAERHLDAPLADVWRVAADLEGELPGIVGGLRSFTRTGAVAAPAADGPGGERFTALAVSSLRHRERFDVVLRPGWCLMQSRLLVGGMAAVEEDSGTRFAMMYAFRFPGGGLLRGFGRLGAAARSRAMLDRLERRVAELRAG
ncbi:hypothetical protein [Streptomyces sp. NPDC021020]|uniref:hypothetical protein n=1 Tax=Streptomyces sp. NPDC021020 TaxID=3365109 RepID=UPI0037B9EDE4